MILASCPSAAHYLRPYDLLSFMTLLPSAQTVLDWDAARVEINGQTHFLWQETLPSARETMLAQHVEAHLQQVRL